MEPLKPTTKSAVFAGSHKGTAHWATRALVMEACPLKPLNAALWLGDVLCKLVTIWPLKKSDALVAWSAAYAAASFAIAPEAQHAP